jgi:chromosome segregation ATPase
MSSNPNVINPGNDPVGSTPDKEVVSQTTPPAITNPGTSQDWESMYKGLQATYNKLFNANAELEKKHVTLNTEHEQIKQELAKTKEDLVKATGTLTEKDKTLLEKQSTVETKDVEVKRLKLIATKYPMLMEMEEQGFFANLKTDELEPKFQALQTSINAAIDGKAKVTLQNTPPSASTTKDMPPVLNADELWAKITTLAGSKDPKILAEYERLYALYLELQKNPMPEIKAST